MVNILRDEVINDPLARGYSGMTDQQIADGLNTKDRPRNRTSMSGAEVKAAIVFSEYEALLPEEKSEILALVARDDLDPFGIDKNIIQGLFGSSGTLTALQIARVELISRAEELGIRKVSASQIHTIRSS